MLILTRKADETICIGDEVTVTVLGIKGKQVRIGVTGPKEIEIHREEVYLRNKDAGNSRAVDDAREAGKS